MTRKLKLGLFNHPNGRHPGGWRLPESHGRADDIEWVIETAQTAERALFDLFFCADSVAGPEPGHTGVISGFEPVTELVAVARATERIGLIATASTTFSEPYNVARLFASLDRISGGRAGWNAVTSQSDAPAKNFGYDRLLDHDERYRRAGEFVDVVRKLWSSFPATYYVGNKATGIYSDVSGVRTIDHVGDYFTVRGPLNVPASAQGRPVIAQAGSSPDGIRLAGMFAEVVYTAQDSLAAGQNFYRAVKDSAAANGRPPHHIAVMPGILPIVGGTDSEAQEIWRRLQELQSVESGLRQLSWRFGFDVTGLDPQGPVPEVPHTPFGQSRVELLTRKAAERGWTLGELAKFTAASNGHRIVIGSGEAVADDLARWFENDAADGFNVIPAYMPGALDNFIEHVVPRLQDRGLFRTEYEGATLRENLGITTFEEIAEEALWPTH